MKILHLHAIIIFTVILSIKNILLIILDLSPKLYNIFSIMIKIKNITYLLCIWLEVHQLKLHYNFCQHPLMTNELSVSYVIKKMKNT